MARKINVVMDPKLVIQEPDETEKVPYRPSYLPQAPQEEDDIDYESIEERESEIDVLVSDFVCDLIGIDSPEDLDMMKFVLKDELEDLKDEFEQVLAEHGIAIYRPAITVDRNGNEIVVDSIYE